MHIRSCPVHGESTHYKETLAMMQAQAHAYAFSCFLYFQHMVKIAKSSEEKSYYQQQQAVAGCMVHGPHGISPASMMPPPFGFPPYFGFHHPDFASDKSASEEKEPVPHLHYQTTFGSGRLTKNPPKDTEKEEEPKKVI